MAKRRKLKKLNVEEVSLVDQGANRRRFAVIKQAEEVYEFTPEEFTQVIVEVVTGTVNAIPPQSS